MLLEAQHRLLLGFDIGMLSKVSIRRVAYSGLVFHRAATRVSKINWYYKPLFSYEITHPDLEESLRRLQVTVVDMSRRLEDLKALEDKWICDLWTVLGPQGTSPRVHG